MAGTAMPAPSAGLGTAGATPAAGAAAAGSAGAPVQSAPPSATAPDAGVSGAGAPGAGRVAGGTGGAAAGAGGVTGIAGGLAAGASGALAPDAGTADPKAYAKELDGLLIDAQCAADTATPLAMMATCLHPPNTQRIEKTVAFGGEAGKTYTLKLRVRGIWEPTKINGGMHPSDKLPLNVGGTLPPGTGSSDPVAYQQYSVRVSEPKQTYWLNDHGYLAHDIHKDDYEATIDVASGAMVIVTMNDGNERQIANWTQDYFEGLPPYADKPSLGQLLHLDVVSVTPKP